MRIQFLIVGFKGLTWFPVSLCMRGLTEGKKRCPGKRIFEKVKLSLTGTTNLYKSIYFGTFVNINYKAVTKRIQNHEPQSSIMNIC